MAVGRKEDGMKAIQREQFYRGAIPLVLVVLGQFLLLGCADDLKGEAGNPGEPGTQGIQGLQGAAGVPGLAVNANKPRYEPVFNDEGDTNAQVVVRASVLKPARVVINGAVFQNTEDRVCDLSVRGRNGRDDEDLQANKIYYLYAIAPEPAAEGEANPTHFELVASSISPGNRGPVLTADWSYLGAFRVNAERQVEAFTVADWGVQYHQRLRIVKKRGEGTFAANWREVSPNRAEAEEPLGEIIPDTTHSVVLAFLIWSQQSVTDAVNRGAFQLGVKEEMPLHEVAGWSQVNSGDAHQSSEVVTMPLNRGLTFWYWVTGSTPEESQLNNDVYLTGFHEDPELWP